MSEINSPASPSRGSAATAESNATAVAEHYDQRSAANSDLALRSESSIYYLRNFNNWIKSVLINEFISKIRAESGVSNASVLDLGCGKGGDILKWKKANVSHVTFADISEKSLQICQERFSRSNFTASFIHLDASRDILLEKYTNDNNDIIQHDLVSCQFALHYTFESFEQANRCLKNVSDSLKPGGFFIGTTTNGCEIVKRLRAAKTNSFGNSNFK